MQVIRLYGCLAAEFGPTHGREFRLAVKSPREALVALGAQIPGFKAAIARLQHGLHVRTGREFRDDESVANPLNREQEEIRLIPATAASNARVRVVVGAVMIVAGYALSSYTGGASLALVSMGAALMIGGIAELLAPKPSSKDQSGESSTGYAFSGTINTTGQGVAIPKTYGTHLDGSHVISARVLSEEGVIYASQAASHGLADPDYSFDGISEGAIVDALVSENTASESYDLGGWSFNSDGSVTGPSGATYGGENAFSNAVAGEFASAYGSSSGSEGDGGNNNNNGTNGSIGTGGWDSTNDANSSFA